MFHRAGPDISGIQATIVPTARVLDAARRAGIPVVYLTMAFEPDLSDIGPEGTPSCDRHLFFGVGQSIAAPDGTKSRVLIRDTWNTEIMSELRPALDEAVVYKHRFSGFFETELDTVIRSLGATDLIFTGCTTSVCVESSFATPCSATTDAFFSRTAPPSPLETAWRGPTMTPRSSSSRPSLGGCPTPPT